LESYQGVCAISRYAQTWIDRYWGVPSLLLPPPAPVEALAPGDKKRQILSVGRFFWGSHNKKHREMIQVFKTLRGQGHLAGWELHLAGTVTPGAAHAAYLAEVRAAAAGAPVYIHTDIAFEGLRRLYGESQIYWHACGYEEDEERAPEKFEHFGITTVEAMAAGCIPIVIARGGQREIVRHGVDGFLWENLDELRRFTLQVTGDRALAHGLAARAMERSRDFGTAAFRLRLDQIIAAL
jgi:glycosyltransferase involved in cell wall biosynthesis